MLPSSLLTGSLSITRRDCSTPACGDCPGGGGEETEVLPSLTGNAFALVSKGIYFGEPNSDGSTSIQFFSFTTGKVITVTTIKRHGYRPVHFAGRKVHSLHASQSRQQQPDASGELWLMPP